ncbi:hypothetical protein BH11PSE10_BH11PSE10_11730 [soil metagenome]
MQNQATQVLNSNSKENTQGPVEIDAALLHLIGGGLPKGTWSPAGSDPIATTEGGGSDLPKGTW